MQDYHWQVQHVTAVSRACSAPKKQLDVTVSTEMKVLVSHKHWLDRSSMMLYGKLAYACTAA